MDLHNTEFKRKFSFSPYKSLKLKMGEMSFCKDFINDTRGDLYPILQKTSDCTEYIEHNTYGIRGGTAKRFFCRFFPYASYEFRANIKSGAAGFSFVLPHCEAFVVTSCGELIYSCNGKEQRRNIPENLGDDITMIVSCRPGAFDIYYMYDANVEYLCTFKEEAFTNSNDYEIFSNASVALYVSGSVRVRKVVSYIDNGVSIADIRPIRYEDGRIMTECGKLYLSASVRMQENSFQGVFSWVPGTAEFKLTGALFYDCGDGKCCGDVAASILYHREEKKWYLWVCSFSHGHILGCSSFEGDPRFGVNVIDIELMEKAPEGSDISSFLGFYGDEDPDFFYDKEKRIWFMAICRLDPKTKGYRYVFFESEDPLKGYRFIGKGYEGNETGGSFVNIEGKLYFLCGNDFNARSDYRIYSENGMTKASFDYPDGGFRGWGTLMPVRAGSRTRYFWMTFDRHRGSNYNWSYGNLYCFEAAEFTHTY
ncbi:MAG: hypothetical protein E7623_00510 [Ruminococcaceae bacterium]|nr:hypothetical protein [Oscillospiraceae bacterium]